MKTKGYLLASASVFAIVALAHASRLILHWPILLGSYDVPQWLSIPGVFVPGGLSAWGFRQGLHLD
jgi:hypothetical protein